MPDIKLVQLATEAQYEAFAKVWADVYGPGWDERNHPHPHPFYLGTVDEEPAFAVSIEEYNVHVRGQFFKAAAVGGVATLGHFRNTGVGTQCLHLLDKVCAEREFDLGLLYGFREPFYRNVGYEHSGWRWKIRAESHRLPKLKQTLPARQIPSETAHAVLQNCHTEFIKTFNGTAIRTPLLWKRRLGKVPPVIYALGDPVEAYFWCNIQGFWDELEIGEFAWSTPRGYESALALIRSLVINKLAATWCEPPFSPFLNIHTDQGITAEKNRPTMFRLIRPENILERFQDRFKSPITLNVTHLDGTSGQTTIRISEGGPQATLSIHRLTQGILGSPSFADLNQFGQIQGDPAAIQTLIDTFPPEPVTCMEFF